ncbi:thiamine-phosphate kinase [Sphingomonas sp. LB-2]|uniref:thiamine-phosphate kinase n=1 Tax=Sphingomonas caeni TaxID=2984949 RepID=UPI00222EE762|nr:thiamine-phosphate kinase [Sphingomonas caeni]MCW3848137.1 thiamine-phosphate kinase [Sphingomonas caeni]
MNEAEFIAALRALPLHLGARGLLDDAAVLPFGDECLILTHDMIAEDVHFRGGDDRADVAWKLVAVNLSDLAAKGAEPVGVLIGASLARSAKAFVTGLHVALSHFDTPLLGGDTIAPLDGAGEVFSCTALGRATHVPVPSRSGAEPGDALWVTGTIGDAGAGLAIARGAEGPAILLERYLRPTPRLAEGRALAPHVHAMMDVSDGLLIDASRMAQASGLAVEIDLALVPLSPHLSDPLAAATAGDDYELLFAAPADFEPPVPATRIGGFMPGSGLSLTDKGLPVPLPARLGYLHAR